MAFLHLSLEHKKTLQYMIRRLDKVYIICTEERDFRRVFTLLDSFRDIITLWPDPEFDTAYDELGRWQEFYMNGEV